AQALNSRASEPLTRSKTHPLNRAPAWSRGYERVVAACAERAAPITEALPRRPFSWPWHRDLCRRTTIFHLRLGADPRAQTRASGRLADSGLASGRRNQR